MIVDMLVNKKISPIVTKLFIRFRQLNADLVFIMQPYFFEPKNIRLNSMYYFIMKILNQPEFLTNCILSFTKY